MAVYCSAEFFWEMKGINRFCSPKYLHTGEWKDYISWKMQFWMFLELDG